jgi:uncharacterized protein (DUF433 family)/predicted nuclease of predicted toxin-antitoxin system
MDNRITFNPAQCGGRPCIRGMRIRVKDVLDLLAAGVPQAEILEDFPYLEPADIQACLDYAAAQADHRVLLARWSAMRFLIDAQMPPALARLLATHGHTAEHVADIGLRNADDSPIWAYALAQQAIIITKDEDFPQRLRQAKSSPVIVWLRIGNTSRRALLEWFEPLLPQIESLISQGDRLIEIR